MNLEINKKLFSNVMNIEEQYIEYITIEENGKMIYKLDCSLNELHKTNFNAHLPNDYYNIKQDFYEEISIYEFAFRCKELAYKNGYNILIECYNKELTEFEVYIIKDYLSNEQYLSDKIIFNEDVSSEIEGIIKATEYILKELKC